MSLVSDVEASTISFLAKTVSFPARSFGTTTYRSGGRFGLDVPYETTFEAVSITMLNTNDHAPRKFWNNWFKHIQNVGDQNAYNMQYYKKFVGTVKILYYSEDAEITSRSSSKYDVTQQEPWPKT